MGEQADLHGFEVARIGRGDLAAVFAEIEVDLAAAVVAVGPVVAEGGLGSGRKVFPRAQRADRKSFRAEGQAQRSGKPSVSRPPACNRAAARMIAAVPATMAPAKK